MTENSKTISDLKQHKQELATRSPLTTVFVANMSYSNYWSIYIKIVLSTNVFKNIFKHVYTITFSEKYPCPRLFFFFFPRGPLLICEIFKRILCSNPTNNYSTPTEENIPLLLER